MGANILASASIDQYIQLSLLPSLHNLKYYNHGSARIDAWISQQKMKSNKKLSSICNSINNMPHPVA
jgi:hypothetical protein